MGDALQEHRANCRPHARAAVTTRTRSGRKRSPHARAAVANCHRAWPRSGYHTHARLSPQAAQLAAESVRNLCIMAADVEKERKIRILVH